MGNKLYFNVGEHRGEACSVEVYSVTDGNRVFVGNGTQLGTSPVYYANITGMGGVGRGFIYSAYRNASPDYEVCDTGDFWWDGTDIVLPSHVAGLLSDAITTINGYTNYRGNSLQIHINSKVDALNDVSVADLDAQTVDIVASQKARRTELSGATNAARDVVIAAIAALNDASLADIAAEVESARVDVVSTLNTRRTEIVGDIAALNNLSVADLDAQTADINAYIAIQKQSLANGVTARRNEINSHIDTTIAALNDASLADIAAEVESARVDVVSTLNTRRTEIVGDIAALNNLSVADLDAQTVEIVASQKSRRTELSGATNAARDVVIAAIAALNDVSVTDVRTEVDASLTAFDPCTAEYAQALKAGLNGMINLRSDSIDTAIAALNDVSVADLDAQTVDINDYAEILKQSLANGVTARRNEIKDHIDTSIAALNDVSLVDISAEVESARVDVVSTLNTRRTEIVGDIAALNNLSLADLDAQTVQIIDSQTAQTTELSSVTNWAMDMVINSITGLNDVSSAEVRALTNSARDTIISAIGDLNNVSAAQIEAALLDDSDGETFKSSIATLIENYLLDDSDGQAVLAGVQGALSAALSNYNAVKKSDTDTLATDIANLTSIVDSGMDGINLHSSDQRAIVTSAIDAAKSEVLGGLGALNDISLSDVSDEMSDYNTAIKYDLELQTTQIISDVNTHTSSDINALNNVSADEIEQVLLLDSGGSGVITQISNNFMAGLSQYDVATVSSTEDNTSQIQSTLSGLATTQDVAQSTADTQTAIDNFDFDFDFTTLATSTDVDDLTSHVSGRAEYVVSSMSGIDCVSLTQLTTTMDNMDFARESDVNQIVQLLDNLDGSQQTLLSYSAQSVNLLEADEEYDQSTAKARKLLRGTNQVLLEKSVLGSNVSSVKVSE